MATGVDCFEHLSTGNVVLGAFLTAGTFLAYVPQFGAIWWDRSSHGVSVVSSFLNALCQSLLSLNGLIMQYPYFQCCESVSAGQCNRLLLSYYQIAANGVGMLIVFSLVIAYFKPSPAELSYRQSALLFGLYVWVTLAAAFVTAAMGVSKGMHNSQTLIYGRVVGILGGICGSLMYIPQLWQTFRQKEVGSLSIGTLAIQFPGSLAVIYYQLFINHLNWSIWVPNVLMAFFQGWLLSMCIYYELRGRFCVPKAEDKDALLAVASDS